MNVQRKYDEQFFVFFSWKRQFCRGVCMSSTFRRCMFSYQDYWYVSNGIKGGWSLESWGKLARSGWYFEEGGVVLWRGCCATLKWVVRYFEEDGVVLWRGWCGSVKRVWYFEYGGVVLWRVWVWRRWCGTVKRVWYFKDGGVVLWRGWPYFEEVGKLTRKEGVLL